MLEPAPKYEFGPFQLDTGARRLLKDNTPVSLAPKSFDLLQVLIENQGRALSKPQLLKLLWPETTVEDSNLAFQVFVLRKALGSGAGSWIETVPRHGYRFTAPVLIRPAGNVPTSASVADLTIHPEAPRASRFLPRAVLATLALALIGVAVLLHTRDRPAPQRSLRAVPLTSFRGFESHPALSPDGNRVAFTWNGEKQNNFDVYVSSVPIRSGGPLRLTTSPARDFAAAWSPDGQKIAFLRLSGGDRGELLLVPAMGGLEQKVAEIRSREIALGRVMSLSWSPDGRWIAAAHREPGDETDRIYAFSMSGMKQRLTTPPKGYHGDYMPAFSPSGEALAFCRLLGFSTSDIHLLPLGPNSLPKAAPRNVTNVKRWSVSPVWIRDGNGILHVFGEHPGARRELRVASISDSRREMETLPIPDEPAEVTAGRSLVYSRRFADQGIWRARIPAPGDPPALAKPFIDTTQNEGAASYSPDGTKIVFISNRSGSAEIWIANADGTNAERMTFFGGPLVGVARWSPDGQRIVFHARPEGQADLFVIPAAGGSPVRLTSNSSDDTLPSYSHDGRWLYFISLRSGYPSIWKMPVAGGQATQVTTSQSTMPLNSADGALVYYYKWPKPNEIWIAPVHGGQPQKVTAPTQEGSLFGFAVTAEGIYYPASPHDGDQRFIRFFPFATRQSHPVVVTDRRIGLGMSVSPNGRYIIFDQIDGSGSDLMLVDNRLPW